MIQTASVQAPGVRPRDAAASPAPVTLDNCDREPIHIPGHIQHHGALLAFDTAGRLVACSDNAGQVLGPGLQLGQPLRQALVAAPEVADALAEFLQASEQPAGTVERHEVLVAGREVDLILHANGRHVVAEFEPRGDDPRALRPFTRLVNRGLGRLRQQGRIDDLLREAVQEVRELTGFDRVMAYRFRHDASGDIVAESVRADLEPFLGRRYPASDIPAQARRLYVASTVRLIADVGAIPVPVRQLDDVPLDMSWATLRAVSPIHIEYLTNMGVAASMSVSIVVGGQLWGMLACHHMAPYVVPYGVRMACDVLGQLLASHVQELLSAQHAGRIDAASATRVRLLEEVVHAEGTLAGLRAHAGELCALLGAGALVACEGTETLVHGDVPDGAGAELVRWLRHAPAEGGMVVLSTQAELPHGLAAALAPWCGVLALQVDGNGHDWLVLLRPEQVETVAWGGRPEKVWKQGPNGQRLTPRGSFDIWRETVRGTAVPWGATDLEIARGLQAELLRAAGARRSQVMRTREQMLAVLGHDLRNPLQTITMASQLLARGSADGSQIGQRISRSSTQMARLIGDVLDVSRLQGGIGLGVQPRPVDLGALVREAAQDLMVGHPGLQVQVQAPAQLPALADGDRIRQLLDNLLGNARQHGEPGRPLQLRLEAADGQVRLAVANHGAPIPPERQHRLFEPWKRESVGNDRNPGGMGLGLYIASEIARGHGGSLRYVHEDGCVVFRFTFPWDRP